MLTQPLQRLGAFVTATQGASKMASSHAHVWRFHLDASSDVVTASARWLDADERRRSERFRSICDRDRFILRRASLRIVVAGVTGMDPSDVRISRAPRGRPRLEGADDLDLSTAHRGSVGLIAVSVGRRIGVDVERPVSDAELTNLVPTCLSPDETELLRQLPPSEQPAFFSRLWSRKEAWMKMSDAGLSIEPHRVCALTSDTLETLDHRCRLVDLDPAAGYVGALVASGAEPIAIEWRHLTASALIDAA